MKVMAWGFDGCVCTCCVAAAVGHAMSHHSDKPKYVCCVSKSVGVCCHIVHLACGATHAQTFIAYIPAFVFVEVLGRRLQKCLQLSTTVQLTIAEADQYTIWDAIRSAK